MSHGPHFQEKNVLTITTLNIIIVLFPNFGNIRLREKNVSYEQKNTIWYQQTNSRKSNQESKIGDINHN